MNKKNKNAIITFDYELSLGKSSGTVEKCIIEPSDIILNLMDKYKGKAVFFADALYILTLKKHNHSDFSKIAGQIKKIITNGHNVEFHLHPQWLDAYEINDREWGFNSFEHYRVHSLKKNQLAEIFNESLALLNEIICGAKSGYKIRAYRAGGWAVQPFEVLKELFIKNGLIYDFSVVPGMKNSGRNNYFDFTRADSYKSSWRFNDNPVLEENGVFYEIPLTMVKMKKIFQTVDYNLFKMHEKEAGDGKSMSDGISDKENKISKILNLFKDAYVPLSLDGLSGCLFAGLIKKCECQKRKFLVAVGHPKKLSKSFVKNLEYLLKNYQCINLFDLDRFI